MSIHSDEIIEAYKRGLEDGRRGDASQMPYGDLLQRQHWPGDSTGNPPVIDTHKVICTSPYIDRSRR